MDAGWPSGRQSPAATDRRNQGGTSESSSWDELLADAVRVLTEAARLRRPVLEQGTSGGWQAHPTRTEPADWAQFVTLTLAGAAANIGGVEKALRGRPGSWEADSVRSMLGSTVGDDPAELLRHRTQPLRLVLRPAEILADLGYDAVYDESQRILLEEQNRRVWRYELDQDLSWRALDEGAPECDAPSDEWTRPGRVLVVARSEEDEQEYDRLLDLEARLEDLRYDGDPRVYGQALRAAVTATSAELFPGVPVEVEVDLDGRRFPELDEFDGPEEQLVEAAQRDTKLPWTGIAPRDYAAREIVDVERAAGRLPHQRLH